MALEDRLDITHDAPKVEEGIDVIELAPCLPCLVFNRMPVFVLVVVPPICAFRNTSIGSPQMVHCCKVNQSPLQRLS